MPRRHGNMPIWGHLSRHEGLDKRHFHYGTVQDRPHVPFWGLYPGDFPEYGDKYEIKLPSGVRKTFNGLGDNTCATMFFIQEKKFDDFVLEAGIMTKIMELKKEILDIEEKLVDKNIACLSGDDSYDPAEDKTLQDDLENANKDLVQEFDTYYQRYDQFIGPTHADAFKRVVEKKVGETVEVKKEGWDFTSKAYELSEPDADGNRSLLLDRPMPEFDEQEPPEGANYGLNYAKVKTQVVLQEPAKRDDLTFQRCRVHYRLWDICGGFYGVADATRACLFGNLRLPHLYMDVQAKELLTTIKNISKHLEYLPCRKDHPDCVNDDRIERRARELNSVEMCDILKRAMPSVVAEQFEKDNKGKNLFDNPDEMATDFDQIIEILPAEMKSEKKNDSQKKKDKKKDKSKSSNNPGGKRCNKCTKMGEKETVITTHYTDECNRWRYDKEKDCLVPKTDSNSNRKAYTPKSKQVHNHNHDDDRNRTPRSSRRSDGGGSSRKRYRDEGRSRRGRSRSRSRSPSRSRSSSWSSDSRSRSRGRSRSPSYDRRDRRSRRSGRHRRRRD